MADLLLSTPGKVAVLSGIGGAPARVSMSAGKNDEFDGNVIITNIEYRQATKQQFMASLRDVIYVYVFGDQMGSIVLSGVAFSQKCETSQSGGTGLRQVMDYYRNYRLARTNDTVSVTIGNYTIAGFMTELSVQALASDVQFLINRFRFTINTLPGSQR